MMQMLGLALSGASLTTKLISAGVVLAVVGIAYGVWHKTVWERGYARAIADIARQDEKAIKRASEARSAVLDCRARGLRWDQSTGQCGGR